MVNISNNSNFVDVGFIGTFIFTGVWSEFKFDSCDIYIQRMDEKNYF